jgi:hypothetical protein
MSRIGDGAVFLRAARAVEQFLGGRFVAVALPSGDPAGSPTEGKVLATVTVVHAERMDVEAVAFEHVNEISNAFGLRAPALVAGIGTGGDTGSDGQPAASGDPVMRMAATASWLSPLLTGLGCLSLVLLGVSVVVGLRALVGAPGWGVLVLLLQLVVGIAGIAMYFGLSSFVASAAEAATSRDLPSGANSGCESPAGETSRQ